MSNSEFIVEDIFELTTRKVVVVTGNILDGEVSSSMFLLSDDSELRVKINTVENLNSGNASIGLIFQPKNETDTRKLMGIKPGEVLIFSMHSSIA